MIQTEVYHPSFSPSYNIRVLGILDDLGFTGRVMDNCWLLLCPATDITNLRAQFSHDDVNRPSSLEGQSFYRGIVSLIPVTTDLLQAANQTNVVIQQEPEITEVKKSQPAETIPQQATDSTVEE